MASSLLSSLAEIVRDPIFRRWRLGRLRGQWPPPEAVPPGPPAYLQGLPAVAAVTGTDPGFLPLSPPPPASPLDLTLPGSLIRLTPAEPAAVFEHRFAMRASFEALHSFGWLAERPDIDPAWTTALWQAWMARHPRPEEGDPVWRADIAAARAVNLLDYARRSGLPGPRDRSLGLLAAHAPFIAHQITQTFPGDVSGIAMEGWGLYRLGVDLGIEPAAAQGLAVLRGEAGRLIRPSGMLDNDSTALHLRFLRFYADAWLAARRHGRPESHHLAGLLRAMLAVLPVLTLPGGLPLIGEVPADCPPPFLSGLLPNRPLDAGWTALLPADEQAILAGLKNEAQLYDVERLAGDGWLRFDSGAWSGLWHGTPDGWCRTPGGHHDLGSFEIHYDGVPIFVDPGSPPLEAEPELASLYRSALAHNGLTLDGRNPYPRARSIYSDAFRRAIAGPPPALRSEHDGVGLSFDGYCRLGGPRHVERRWSFAGDGMEIIDTVLGTGRFLIERRLITPLPVEVEAESNIVHLGGRRLRLVGDVKPVLHEARRWTAQGTEEQLSVILLAIKTDLPWQGRLMVEPE